MFFPVSNSRVCIFQGQHAIAVPGKGFQEDMSQPANLESLLQTVKPTVERHEQTEIRVIVSPVPYSKVVRESYAEGWRTAVTR